MKFISTTYTTKTKKLNKNNRKHSHCSAIKEILLKIPNISAKAALDIFEHVHNLELELVTKDFENARREIKYSKRCFDIVKKDFEISLIKKDTDLAIADIKIKSLEAQLRMSNKGQMYCSQRHRVFVEERKSI